MKREGRRSERRRIDIRGVALRAGVSIATVSRALNGVPTVDSALAARVWKAAQELKYTPDMHARALVSGKSGLLGLIVSEITNPFFPELIREFEKVAVPHGYEVLLGSTNNDPAMMGACLQRMLDRKVEGLAVMTFGFEDAAIDLLPSLRVPMVYIGKAPTYPTAAALAVDYAAGILEGVQHLVSLGHREIAFIQGPKSLHSAQARRSAFVDSLGKASTVVRRGWILDGDHTLEGGRDAVRRLLGIQGSPTAVMCSNDVTAIGVQHGLFEANLRVPDDFSLIGFDDIHLAEYTIPPLTTVRMSCSDLAKKAMNSILSRRNGRADDGTDSAGITTTLVVRKTTGAPRQVAR